MAGPGIGGKALTIVFVSVVSWYTGIKFWKPIVIEHLKEEDRLRSDIKVDYDPQEQPKSWEDLREKVKGTWKRSLSTAEAKNLEQNLTVIEEVKKEKENEK